MSEFRETEHFVELSRDHEGNHEIRVLHPESCPEIVLYQQTSQSHGPVTDKDCNISRELRDWGFDLSFRDVEDGMYLATYWATPASYIGGMAIDADAGIELTKLVGADTVTQHA